MSASDPDDPDDRAAPDAAATRPHNQCPMDQVLRQLMGPWTTYILWLLRSQGPQRFGAIKAHMPGISAKMLTERLRHLEASGLVHRDYRPTIPPSVTYSLTTRGGELNAVLDGLNLIALKWAREDAQALAESQPEPGQAHSMLN